MEETIYNLLLTGEQGIALFGTLRVRVLAPAAPGLALPVQAALLPAPVAAQPLGTATFVALPLQGSLSVPLLTGFGRVPLNGVLLLSPAAGLAYDLSSNEPSRRLIVKFNNTEGVRIAGGLLWQPGSPAQLAFSFIGTRLQLPF